MKDYDSQSAEFDLMQLQKSTKNFYDLDDEKFHYYAINRLVVWLVERELERKEDK